MLDWLELTKEANQPLSTIHVADCSSFQIFRCHKCIKLGMYIGHAGSEHCQGDETYLNSLLSEKKQCWQGLHLNSAFKNIYANFRMRTENNFTYPVELNSKSMQKVFVVVNREIGVVVTFISAVFQLLPFFGQK